MSEPVARSPIEPAPPVLVVDGWEVSGRRAQAGLTLTDCTPLAKVGVRAPVGGRAAAELAVPFGRAVRDSRGTLVAGSGPGSGCCWRRRARARSWPRAWATLPPAAPASW